MGIRFGTDLLGWRHSKKNKLGWSWVPNSADIDNVPSLLLAEAVLDNLGIPNPNKLGEQPVEPPDNPGGLLETQVRVDLSESLPMVDPSRRWGVYRGRKIIEYAQYQHLAAMDAAIAADANLRVTMGTDYIITPDVTVGLAGTPTRTGHPWLHAAVACKWTIRSDRVQNIRHENSIMIRHRRGRLPHLVAVTAEPLPSRLASIARGTGEVDATYHYAFEALSKAVADVGGPKQREDWDEVVGQGRLLDYSTLGSALACW